MILMGRALFFSVFASLILPFDAVFLLPCFQCGRNAQRKPPQTPVLISNEKTDETVVNCERMLSMAVQFLPNANSPFEAGEGVGAEGLQSKIRPMEDDEEWWWDLVASQDGLGLSSISRGDIREISDVGGLSGLLRGR
jgi:hypothetical protein